MPPGLDPEDKRQVDFEFSQGKLIDGDSLNTWSALMMPDNIDFKNLKPVLSYADFYGRQSAEAVEKKTKDLPPKLKNTEIARLKNKHKAKDDYIMKLSDKEQIRAFNKLVIRFNTDLTRIKREEDIEILKYYMFWAKKICSEKKRLKDAV